ncbi:MAG: DUF4350 domain-containing protein [Oscillospiraceae bacterium]|jgi:hypothetical protein|nr:DUF4350 domain-containing protein [Oscillospiraceae bacterium]
MKKTQIFLLFLALAFAACGLFLAVRKPPDNLPFDSRANGAYGVRALYLTLEELGFHVARKTVPLAALDTGGAVLVFGTPYLAPEDPEALKAWETAGNLYYVAEPAEMFANGAVEPYAVWRLTNTLWAYRGDTIWFDEYGRSATAYAGDRYQLTPTSILPVWVFLALVQLGLALLLGLLFWNQRTGPPARGAYAGRRGEQEDTRAMAALMARARLLPDALALCYRHLTDKTRQGYPHIEAAIARAQSQPQNGDGALALAAEMDRIREEAK